jgi:nitroimidazol reductase NimA-like FMN-containing flavoprotein (pyridoxamine 5'-phosphate oxidase superfamily)
MTRAELLAFLRRHRLCVQASDSAAGAPQAAVVGFGVSDDLEIVFDTLGVTRKMDNLRRDPRIALVVGWDDDQTVQIEGVADEPTGAELARLKQIYFAAYPDGPMGETELRASVGR